MSVHEKIEHDADEIVVAMLRRNPQLREQMGREGGVSLEEFAFSVIVQWKTKHAILYPLEDS